MRAALLALLVSGSGARAADLAISASVDKNTITLDEQVVLRVSISGNSTSIPDPSLPAMPNFNIHSAGRSQNISIINGTMSSSVEHTFVLVPRFPGKAVIGPITVAAGGTQAQTSPIEIAVVRPSGAPSPGRSPGTSAPPPSAGTPSQGQSGSPDLLVLAEVDKQKPYVNEQTILSVRFYTAIPLLGNAEWVPPPASGFLIEDLPPGPHQQASQGGRRYYVSEVKLALFPAQAGRLTIGQSAIRCQVQPETVVDPFSPDFFQKFFSSSMTPQVRELKTKPITLEVLPLPDDGKPASFTGAVGHYRVKAEADKKSVKAGEAVNLSLTVEGTGNLKALGELKLPEMASWRVFDTVTSLNLDKGSGGVKGTKVYKTVLVPKVSGPLSIPSIPFSYFDPERKEYVEAKTESIPVQVAPGAAVPAASYVSPGSGKTSITPMNEDIGYIKDRIDESWLSRSASALGKWGWWHAIPLGLFLACLAFSVYRDHINQNPAAVRWRSALPRAEGRIREARAQVGPDPQRAAGMLNDALSGYLADKLNRPASSLTRKQTLELLRSRFSHLPSGHLDRLKSLWEELEMFRFAPTGHVPHGPDGTHLSEGLMELIQALEEELK